MTGIGAENGSMNAPEEERMSLDRAIAVLVSSDSWSSGEIWTAASGKVGVVEGAWAIAWRKLVAPYIRETRERRASRATVSGGAAPKPDTPGVQLHELADDVYAYVSRPNGALRQAAMLFNRFGLEAFVEDRSAFEYSSNLQQEMVAFVAENRQSSENIAKAIRLLDSMESIFESKRLTAQVSQIASIRKALRASKAMTDEAASIFDDQGFKTRLLDRCRARHARIQSAWGTWPRRIKKPILALLVGLGATLLLQSWIGLWTGVNALVVLVAWSACVAVTRYYGSRNEIIASKDKDISVIASFDPRLALYAKLETTWETIWLSENPAEIVKLATLAYTNVTGRSQSSPNYRGSDATVANKALVIAAYTGLILALLIPPVTSFGTLPSVPVFAVDRALSDRICTLTRGYLLWPGPLWAVVAPDGENTGSPGLTLVPLSQTSRLVRTTPSQSIGAGASCGSAPQTSSASAGSVTFISNMRGADRGVLVVPFLHTAQVPCGFDDPEARSKAIQGVEVEPGYKEVLLRLGRRLRECASRDPNVKPVLDIRGFSSEADFAGSCSSSTKSKNLTLAETRRQRVWELLDGLDHSGNPLPEAFTVFPPRTQQRWSSLEHMHDFSSIREIGNDDSKTKGDLTQRVEVWFETLGACSAELPLLLR